MRSNTIVILSCVFFSFVCYGAEVSRKVEGELGKKMIESLYPNPPKYKIAIEENDKIQDFIVYEVIGELQGMKDDFAVNPWTGDVWNLWNCHQVTSDFIAKEQVIIKQLFKPNEMPEYKQLHILRPMNVGLDPC